MVHLRKECFSVGTYNKLKIDLKFSSSQHPKTNGKIEVVNHSLENLLRCLVGDKSWFI